MKLTILMPCLNEIETLSLCINKAKNWISKYKIEAEILIADNGSTDNSQQAAELLGARVINVNSRGYGSALYHGCMAANGEYIILGDSDNSYDFSNLDLFIEKLDEGFDLVVGNRFIGKIDDNAMPWKNRYIGNPLLTWIGRLLFKCPINDFHCGLRGVKKEAFLRMDLRTTGMEFASEMIIKATILGMRITEVPTTLSKDGRSRPPHLRPWRDGWRHLRFMLLFSPRWLFILPGSVLFIISFTIYFIILVSPLKIGSIVFDVHTLFYAQSGMTLGFLSVNLGIITRMFGIREGLLNGSALLNKLRSYPILEIGSITGMIMIAGGIYLGFLSVLTWNAMNFGPITQGNLLRTVSLSTSLIMLGGITVISSLIMGFLTLPTKDQRV